VKIVPVFFAGPTRFFFFFFPLAAAGVGRIAKVET